jgi:hypothetical protein
MLLPDYRLLPTQSDKLFEALTETEINVRELKLRSIECPLKAEGVASTDNVITTSIEHGRGFHFTLMPIRSSGGKVTYGIHCSPWGQQRSTSLFPENIAPEISFRGYSIAQIIPLIKKWAEYLKRELEAPNF